MLMKCTESLTSEIIQSSLLQQDVSATLYMIICIPQSIVTNGHACCLLQQRWAQNFLTCAHAGGLIVAATADGGISAFKLNASTQEALPDEERPASPNSIPQPEETPATSTPLKATSAPFIATSAADETPPPVSSAAAASDSMAASGNESRVANESTRGLTRPIMLDDGAHDEKARSQLYRFNYETICLPPAMHCMQKQALLLGAAVWRKRLLLF